MWLSRFKYYCTIHLTIKETEEPKSNSLLWNTIPRMLLDTRAIHSPNFLYFFNILLPKHFLQTILKKKISRNSNEQLMGEVSSRSPSLIKLSKISCVVLKSGPKISKALCLILNAKSSSSRIQTQLNFKVSYHRLRRYLLLILDYSYKWFQNIH